MIAPSLVEPELHQQVFLEMQQQTLQMRHHWNQTCLAVLFGFAVMFSLLWMRLVVNPEPRPIPARRMPSNWSAIIDAPERLTTYVPYVPTSTAMMDPTTDYLERHPDLARNISQHMWQRQHGLATQPPQKRY